MLIVTAKGVKRKLSWRLFMAKYRVKFKAIATCCKDMNIQNEADPYTEADEIKLTNDDFDIDISSASIVYLKPTE